MAAAWGQTKQESTPDASYGREYYASQYAVQRAGGRPVRMSLVGKENTCKTGQAYTLARAHTDKKIVVFDIDSSAENTLDFIGDDNVQIITLFDEADDSIFKDDNSTDWMALVEKVKWMVNIVGQDAADGNVGAVIFDGGSTFLKWCEFVMTESLLRRGVIKEEGDSFNQKEWRERNRIFRDVVRRVHALPVAYVFYTFHLKDIKEYIEIGDGKKALATIGQKVDWIEGTQRFASQQLWMTRYTQKGDKAAGVVPDKDLGPSDWIVKCRIEEMKGENMEHLGKEYTVLEVRDGEPKWNGLPLTWGEKDEG